jgi:hypothetical protein
VNGVALILRALHHGEEHLAGQLMTVAERHRTEHEVHHVAIDLAGWSREHLQRLTEASREHNLDLGDPAGVPTTDVQSMFRENAAQAVGTWPEPGLLLLRDLRSLHLAATENSLHWEMLAQVAQATKHDKLLALASACHPQTLRQMRWTNTMIKALSPQILASR